MMIGETGLLVLELYHLDCSLDFRFCSDTFPWNGRVKHDADGMRLISRWNGKICPGSSIRVVYLIHRVVVVFPPR